MRSPEPLENGPPTISPQGEVMMSSIYKALEAFNRNNENIRKEVTDLRIETGSLGTASTATKEELARNTTRLENLEAQTQASNITLAEVKGGTDRNSAKLDNLETLNITLADVKGGTDRNSATLASLETLLHGMKQDITALGVKANTNILVQSGGFLGVIAAFITILLSLNSMNRNWAAYPPAVTPPSSPATKTPPAP